MDVQQPNPSCLTDLESWQSLVADDPDKALAIWTKREQQRSLKRARYAEDLSYPPNALYDWRVFLFHNPPEGDLTDSDDETGTGNATPTTPTTRDDVFEPHSEQYPIIPMPSVQGTTTMHRNGDGYANSNHNINHPGSPRDGNFCEDRYAWHVACLPAKRQTFRMWAWSVSTSFSRRQISAP